jgi:hypothetical protein
MRDQLLATVRRVRLRWRLRLVFTGLAVVLGAALLVAAGSALVIDRLRFDPGAVAALRLAAWIAVGALAIRFLAWPLSRRVSDLQVALYLEEHEPSLGGIVLSAVECSDRERDEHASRALVERIVERAVERCEAAAGGRRVERARLHRASGAMAGVAAAGALLLLAGPAWLGRGASALLPWNPAARANPYRIEISPGQDTVVARGSDLRIGARLTGFGADEVDLVVRRGGQGEWARWPMVASDSGSYSSLLLDLDGAAEIFVEAGGVRSPVVRVDVADLPWVRSIALQYRFPAYTGLETQRVEGTGDIAALVGTTVRVEVTPTVAPGGGGGWLVVDGRDSIALVATDSGFAAAIRVTRSGAYRVVFDAATGGRVVGSPEYLIDALADQPPTIRFETPGRDIQVTAVEEVLTRVRAADDYGIAAVELRYSVNGEAEQRVSLISGGRRKDAAAGHTFYLEELGLEPGDFVSYHARATEVGRPGAAQEAATDIYFLEVRPLERSYRQADQGMAGGGGGGDMSGELSERQKQIVAGTFNLVRDGAKYDERERREHLATLALAQGRLREEVATLGQRIEERGIAQLDSTFATIAQALEQAVKEMGGAEGLLGERKPAEALGPEQRALKHLQRAEATFRDVQVARGQGGGGGRAGGMTPNAEELADLFDLEMDRLENQYERLERGRREEADQQMDEALEKLRELARRQQQENERARARAEQLASRGAGGGGGTGDAQRRLAQETEDLARRLERLAREQRRSELTESARRLREAADAMRRAAAQGTDASAQGRGALDDLREARRRLETERGAGLRTAANDALRRSERLAEQQREVATQVEALADGAARSADAVRRLQERKADMAQEVQDLERDLDRLAQESRRDQREASGKLADAARFVRDAKVREKLLFSRGVIQGRSPEYARNFEEQIGQDLEQLRERVANARDAIGESREQRVARALEETQNLVRELESLSDRMGRQEGREGQQGEPGQRGQSGQEGQQGQPGQAGERGQGADRGALSPAQPGGGGPGWGVADPRQLRRDLREGIADAESLRRMLSAEGVDVSDLERYIARLRALDGREAFGDAEAQRTLELDIVQGLKEFEFAVRRQFLEGDQQKLFLSGSDEVPAAYRRLVEEYYRALSEGRVR